MTSESRWHALERLSRRIEDNADPLDSPYPTAEAAVDDSLSMLRPFLLNPDRHEEHVRAILKYLGRSAVFQVFSALIRKRESSLVGFLLPIKPLIKISDDVRPKFIRSVQDLHVDYLKRTDPGELQIDVLPLRSLPTHPDWLTLGRRLVQIETRTAVHPSEGFTLQSVSHRIEVSAPSGVQFVDTIPSTVVEDVGSVEWTVSNKGKFLHESSVEAEGGGSASLGAAQVESKLKASQTDQHARETGASRKESRTARLNRVISSAIGPVAQWELIRTPTQVLQGGAAYVANLLIPVSAATIELEVELFARIDQWGRADHVERRELEVPRFDETTQAEE